MPKAAGVAARPLARVWSLSALSPSSPTAKTPTTAPTLASSVKPSLTSSKDKNKENKDKEKSEKQPTPGKLLPQQAKQLLKALENEEKKTQKKINAKRVKVKTAKQEKDW